MSYARLEAEGGLQWPCYDEPHPGETFLHSRLWERPVGRPARAVLASSSTSCRSKALDDEFPLRLTTGRRLAEYNTGVQTGGYASPMRRGETIDMSPEDAARLGFREGQPVRVRSRRGEVVVPVHIDPALRPGLTFMTLHFPDEVATNQLTIDATDPEVGHGRVQGGGHPPRSPWRRSQWTSTSSGPKPPTTSARRSTRCWAHPTAAGTAARATWPATAAPRGAAGRRRSSSGTCCCRRSTPCRIASAG